MSYFKFASTDKISTTVVTTPFYSVRNQGNVVTGSLYLEKPYLLSSLNSRLYLGFSENEGGLVNKIGPFTASVTFMSVISGGINSQLWNSLGLLYQYYFLQNSNYTASFNSTSSAQYQVIVIPEVYYDRQIATGTFTASAFDISGTLMNLYDDGHGGIYSGSVSGTILGNIFYSEGFAVLKAPNLLNFGYINTSSFNWNVSFSGQQTIPVNIWRCMAPAGQLNASTNRSFYYVPTTGTFVGQKQILSSSMPVYITAVGLYNSNYELVGIAKLAQPIRKDLESNLEIRVRLDR